MLRNRAPERFAEGRPKGLNAVGQMELKRLKKQWCEEYERKQAQGGEARVFASIEAKIAKVHQRRLDSRSPPRPRGLGPVQGDRGRGQGRRLPLAGRPGASVVSWESG
ncbi:hypothetical protein AAG596_02565 [Citromicrobium bathyomarinum]|uniref:hypothetical protein n=1 Tax=Citromicrobium bathyomarinum TaxID=72174 RepID=UPI00315ACC37